MGRASSSPSGGERWPGSRLPGRRIPLLLGWSPSGGRRCHGTTFWLWLATRTSLPRVGRRAARCLTRFAPTAYDRSARLPRYLRLREASSPGGRSRRAPERTVPLGRVRVEHASRRRGNQGVLALRAGSRTGCASLAPGSFPPSSGRRDPRCCGRTGSPGTEGSRRDSSCYRPHRQGGGRCFLQLRPAASGGRGRAGFAGLPATFWK